MPTVLGPTFSSHLPANDAESPREHDGNRKDPDDLFQTPVIRSAAHHAMNPSQSRIENAPRVHRANTKVNGDGRNGNAPAVEVSLGDDAFFGEETRHSSLSGRGTIAVRRANGKWFSWKRGGAVAPVGVACALCAHQSALRADATRATPNGSRDLVSRPGFLLKRQRAIG